MTIAYPSRLVGRIKAGSRKLMALKGIINLYIDGLFLAEYSVYDHHSYYKDNYIFNINFE